MSSSIPLYGFKVNLNHVYPEKRSQNFRPKWYQIWALIPLAIRYIFYYWKLYREGRVAVMDYIRMQNGKQIYGVPIGGIGGGSIGRGYRGEFCRYQLRPGMYEYNTVYANQFIVVIKNADQQTIFQSVLSAFEKPSTILQSWKSLIDPRQCSYIGLYPRSWTVYDLTKYGVKLTCRQVSPVIPNNYKDTSIPGVVFIWSIENTCTEDRHVTIAFTFKNGTKDDHNHQNGSCTSSIFTDDIVEGVLLKHKIHNMPCTYIIGAKKSDHIQISKTLYFDPLGDGEDVWFPLQNSAQFLELYMKEFEIDDDEIGIGIAGKCTVHPNDKKDVELFLGWHMPNIYFGKYTSIIHEKYYTIHFGNTDETPKKLANYALNNYKNWDLEISSWQDTILNDINLPDWYKSAIFNELYYVSDGGAIWLKLQPDEISKLSPSDPRMKFGRFGYLEGHEYRMYNTYDVHFYASFALAMLWPTLQVVLQYDFRDSVFVELTQTRKSLYDGKVEERKCKNSVPHDLGDPDENPFTLINAYPIHDVTEWRDLNSKFVLTVFRDHQLKLMGDDYIKDMYTACRTVMERSAKWDTDGDGLIENSGAPDQTYDLWVMKGPSAYCGSLWLAALHAMVHMSKQLGFVTDFERYNNLLKRGVVAFDQKLWNGMFYNFDASSSPNELSSVMSDQLCGHWYLRCCGFHYEIFPKEKVKSALETIFRNNVMKFANGTLGAVNGYLSHCDQVDTVAVQSEEVWTGITYSLASTMIFEDMTVEAWKTAGNMYKAIYERFGLSFETPEAIYEHKSYRAIGYMRPLSIWSMQLAWQNRKKEMSEGDIEP